MDKTLEMASTLAREVFSGVSGVVVKYGPDVVDMTFWVVRINALQDLVIGFFFVITAIVSWKMMRNMYKRGHEAEDKNDDASPYFFGMCASAIALAVSCLVSSLILLSVWSWIAIAKPELYLAKKAYDTVFQAVKKK